MKISLNATEDVKIELFDDNEKSVGVIIISNSSSDCVDYTIRQVIPDITETALFFLSENPVVKDCGAPNSHRKQLTGLTDRSIRFFHFKKVVAHRAAVPT